MTSPQTAAKRCRCERGMTLLEVLVVVAIIGIIAAILLPAYIHALRTSESRALFAEGRSMMTAILQYYHDQNRYPATLDLASFEPLRTLRYYRGNVTDRLLDGAVDVYESPDDLGPNQEFFMEMTLKDDPSYRVLVADSDDAPLSGGRQVAGIVLYRNGVPVDL